MKKPAKILTLDWLKTTACAGRNAHLFEQPQSKSKAKRAKYNNEKVEWGDLVFDSRKEYKRYRELLLLQKAGLIGQIERQVKYELIPANEKERKCEYWCDFRYIDVERGLIVEDVKSEMTRKLPVYIMKRKLMKQIHNIEIQEI